MPKDFKISIACFWKRFLCWMSNNSSGNNSMRFQRYSIPHIVDVNKVCNCLKKALHHFSPMLQVCQKYHIIRISILPLQILFQDLRSVMYILENILWNLYLKVYLTYSLSIRVLYLQLIVCCCRAKSNWTKQRKHFQKEKNNRNVLHL